jgi:hypothetical protein
MEAKLKQLEKCVKGVQKRVDALQSEMWFRKYGVTGCSLLEYFRTHSYLKDGNTEITRSGKKIHNSCLWQVSNHGRFKLRDFIGMLSSDPQFTGIRTVLEQTRKDVRMFSHLSEFELSAKFSQHKTCLTSTRRRMCLIAEDLELTRLNGYITRFQTYFETHVTLKASAWTLDADGDTYDQSVSISKNAYSEDEYTIWVTDECSEFHEQYTLWPMTGLLLQHCSIYDTFYRSANRFGCCMSMVEECLTNMVMQLDHSAK